MYRPGGENCPAFSFSARQEIRLGLEEIECFVTEDDETACRMWEISENLHRAELPQMERDRLVAEWERLTGKEVSRQVAQKPPQGRITAVGT